MSLGADRTCGGCSTASKAIRPILFDCPEIADGKKLHLCQCCCRWQISKACRKSLLSRLFNHVGPGTKGPGYVV